MFQQQISMFVGVSMVLVMALAEAERESSRSPAPRPRQQPEVVSCEQRASCGVANANARLPFYTRNCFCDALCLTYGDCCADFRPESVEIETGNSLPNLPRSAISCARVEEIDTAYEIYIVTKCPRRFSDRAIRDGCENAGNAGEFFQLPVSGVASGVLYRNAYCAICANESAYLFWRMAHLCVGVGGGGRGGAAPDVRQMMRCPPELLPPEVGDRERMRPRKCKSHVAQCEPRRRGSGRGGRLRRRCRGPTSYVYDGLQVHTSCFALQPRTYSQYSVYTGNTRILSVTCDLWMTFVTLAVCLAENVT